MMNRRLALKEMMGAMSVLILGAKNSSAMTSRLSGMEAEGQATPMPAPSGPFTLPALPYSYDALEPYFDAETMHLHHDKHHQSYVDKLNAAVAGYPDLASRSVYDLVANLDAMPMAILNAVRNNGGGHANHSFWWTTLAKSGSAGAGPKGELAKVIDAKFGSFSSFQEKLTAAATGVFGSGWAWLVLMPGGELEIQTTPNQDSPLTVGHKPVLGIDVWEHSYYLKYKNKRPDYVKAYFSVIDWDGVSAKFADAK